MGFHKNWKAPGRREEVRHGIRRSKEHARKAAFSHGFNAMQQSIMGETDRLLREKLGSAATEMDIEEGRLQVLGGLLAKSPGNEHEAWMDMQRRIKMSEVSLEDEVDKFLELLRVQGQQDGTRTNK